MEYLKQSTAFTETIGPCFDSTGAEYTGLVIGDLSLSKNGTEAAMAAAATLTHVSNGHYSLVGTTGNSDTLGRATIRCNKSTYQVPPKEYMVLPATVYDALVTNAATAAGGLGDVQRVGGVTQSPGDLYATITNIAVTSAALNSVSSTAAVTTGTETNTYTSTAVLDGTYHSVADVAGTTDFYYEFDVSATTGATGTGITWDGYLSGVANTMKVYAYNWGGSAWQQIGTVTGIAGTNIMQNEWEITNSHTGTGGNLGKVRIRFSNTGLTASSLKTDRILLGYAVVLTPPANWSLHSIDASGRVDVIKIAGATQTARDIGTSVLLSSGTGTGQVKLSSGYIAPNWGDVGNPTTTLNLSGTTVGTITAYTGNTVQTGDSYARIGAGGISLSAIPDEAGVTTLLARLTSTRGGYLDNLSAGAVATAAAVAALPTSTAIRNAVTGGAYALDTDANGRIRIVDGTAAGELDTNAGKVLLAATQAFDNTGTWTGNITGSLSGSVGSVTGAVGSVTGAVGSVTGAVGSVTGAVGSVAGSVGSIASGGIAAASLATAAGEKLADITLRRSQTNVEASSFGDTLAMRSMYGMIQQAQKSSTLTHTNKLTVFKLDGTTELGQITLTADATANPITSAL